MTHGEMHSLASSIVAELNRTSLYHWQVQDDGDGMGSHHITTEDNGAVIFLSDTWGGKGKLHLSASCPRGMDSGVWVRAFRKPGEVHGSAPSINVSLTKTPLQIAGDITRRLMPELLYGLKVALEKDAEAKEYDRRKRELIRQVAEVMGAKVPSGDGEMVHGRGSIDVQVTGQNSMRLYGHCMYVTLEQLKRIRAAVPELFEPERTEASCEQQS